MAISIDLSEGWAFQRGRASRRWLRGAGRGAPVDLPHCWNDSDGFRKGVAYYRGAGAYRRTADIATPTDDGSRWFLESDGFYGTGTLYINDRRAGRFDGQYLGLREEITPFLREGRLARIALRLTNRCAADVLPGNPMPDFLLYGGLSGAVRLVRRPRVFCDERRLALRCVDLQTAAPVLRVAFALVNTAAHALPIRTVWQVHGADGQPVGPPVEHAMEIPAATTSRAAVMLPLASLARWHVDQPVLHELRCAVLDEGRETEGHRTRFGIRQAEFRPRQGFFLNGERLVLRGGNRHESLPGFGRALPPRQHREDAMLLKDLGMNFVRLSHYPHHPAFLDACDELGLLVFSELASWKSVRTGRWLKRAVRQMHDLVCRDRNRPSIIVWGLGNESRSRRAFERLERTVRALDPDRPISYAENHLYRAQRQHTLDCADVWGCNYELDRLDEVAGHARTGNVIVTECSNTPYAERGHPAAEVEQAQRLRDDLARFEGKPHVAGYALWCFNDYATYRKKRYRRFSGIVDAWRLPKQAAREHRAAHAGAAQPHCAALWDAVAPGGGQHATRLLLRPEPCEPQDATRAVLVFAVDETGAKDDRWSGDIRVTRDGPGRLHTLGNDGTVWVRAGVGRFFVTAAPNGEPIRLKAEHPDLAAGWLPDSLISPGAERVSVPESACCSRATTVARSAREAKR